MVQCGSLDRASERRLRSCAGGRRIDNWLKERSPTCVSVSEFKTVSTVIELTPDQFQFLRALYVGLPPVSRTLPPGEQFVTGDAVMLALVADGQACARFLAPDFIRVGHSGWHGRNWPHPNARRLPSLRGATGWVVNATQLRSSPRCRRRQAWCRT
jgi:hypothetical protein